MRTVNGCFWSENFAKYNVKSLILNKKIDNYLSYDYNKFIRLSEGLRKPYGQRYRKERWKKAVEQKEISKAVISRLPRYYRYLGELLEEGVERISSNDLSIRMKVTASQIRQDLNNFGGFGQQGYGYNVKYLYSEIARILGIDRQHNLIIIGAGNLGQAIANYTNFERRGFLIKGMFDVNPRLVGLVVRGVEIRGIEDLEQFIKDNEVQIAALTIPKSKAPEIAERLVKAGIKAIWNFAHTDLQVPDDVVVENVHLSESLMRLSYRVCSMQDQKAREEAQRKQEEAAGAGETK